MLLKSVNIIYKFAKLWWTGLITSAHHHVSTLVSFGKCIHSFILNVTYLPWSAWDFLGFSNESSMPWEPHWSRQCCPIPLIISIHLLKKQHGVPVVAQWEQIWLVPRRIQAQSLALLSGSGIRHSYELCYRSQMRLRSCIAVAVV